jgi:hypothetical protein
MSCCLNMFVNLKQYCRSIVAVPKMCQEGKIFRQLAKLHPNVVLYFKGIKKGHVLIMYH